jgi:hypothetical protein
MQQVQEKQTGFCANCGADGRKRTWRDAIRGNRYVRIRSDAHKFNGSEVLVLVCKVCGMSNSSLILRISTNQFIEEFVTLRVNPCDSPVATTM